MRNSILLVNLKLIMLLVIIAGLFEYCTAKTAMQYFNSGRNKYTVEDFDGASDDFLSAIEKDPLMGDAYRALLSIWDKQNKGTRSIEFIEKTMKQHGIDLDIDFKCYLYYKLAHLYCETGDIQKSEQNLENGFRINDTSPDYKRIKDKLSAKKRVLVSQALKKVKSLMSSDLNSALIEAQNGLKIDYTNKELRDLMGDIKSKIRDIEKTEEAKKYLARIKSKLRANAWDEAIEACNEALAVQPDNEEFLSLRERAVNTKERYFQEIEAKRQREEEIKTRAAKIDYFLKLGKRNMEREQWELATEAFENVKKLDPANSEALKWMNQAKEAMRLSESIKEGQTLFEDGKWQEAAKLFKYAVDKVPSSKKYALLLSKTYMEISRYDEAVEVLKNYLKLNPKANEFNNKIGDVYAMKNDHVNAMTYFRKYLETEPNDLDVTLKVGNSYKDMGQEDQAVAFFKSAAEKLTTPQDKIKVYKELAASYEKAGDKESAMNTYRSLLEIDSTLEGQMVYYYKLGNIYYNDGQYNQALERYKEVEKIKAHYLDIDEKIKDCTLKKYMVFIKFLGAVLGLFLLKFLMGLTNPLMDMLSKGKKDKLFQKAKVLRQQGKWEKAINVCEEILKMPIEVNEAKEVRLAVAHASFKLEKYDRAVSESAKVLDLDRNNKKAYKILGQTYMARQEYDRAIEQCKYVFDFDINNVAMHEIMQQAYKALNNYEELIMEYEEMTHMNPDNMQLRNMLLKLQKEQND